MGLVDDPRGRNTVGKGETASVGGLWVPRGVPAPQVEGTQCHEPGRGTGSETPMASPACRPLQVLSHQDVPGWKTPPLTSQAVKLRHVYADQCIWGLNI